MDGLLIILFIGAAVSVPIACFALSALYSRAGFSARWTMSLNILGALAIISAASLLSIFIGGGPAQTGFLIIFITAILATLAAVHLAFRKWPAQGQGQGPKP